MISKTIQVETGNSRKTISKTEILSSVFSEKARKSALRTLTSPNKRRHVRNKIVWECWKCSGVESPAEKHARIQNEQIAREQDRLAKEKEFAERKKRVENEMIQRNIAISPRLLAKEISRDKRISEGSFNRFLVVLFFQFILSLGLLYIPMTEFYLRRIGLAGLKFFLFYVAIMLFIALDENINLVIVQMTVPVVMGVMDFFAGYKFFGKNIRPVSPQTGMIMTSAPPPFPDFILGPPSLGNSESKILVEDKQK